jgi:hypothetical protein
LAAGILPGAALGVAMGTEVLPAGWPFLVTAGLAYFPERASDIAGVAFGLSTGWLGVCAEPLNRPRVEGLLCSQVFLGAFHSSVSNTQALQNGDRIWSAASLSARLRLRMASQVFAELGGEALAPLQTPGYGVVGGASPSFHEAQVCADAFVGVGLSIP